MCEGAELEQVDRVKSVSEQGGKGRWSRGGRE